MRLFPDLRDYKPLLYLYSVLCNIAGIGMIRVLIGFDDFALKDLLQDETIVACLLLLSVDLPVLIFIKHSAEINKYKFLTTIKEYMIFIAIKAVFIALYFIYMNEFAIVTLFFIYIAFGIWIFLGIEVVIVLVVIIVYIHKIKRAVQKRILS